MVYRSLLQSPRVAFPWPRLQRYYETELRYPPSLQRKEVYFTRVTLRMLYPFTPLDPPPASRYSTRASIVHTLIPHLLPNRKHPSLLIMPPPLTSVFPPTSSPALTSSQRAPAGLLPASLQNSTVASVCPLRSLTPPFLAWRGKTCPGRRRSPALESGEASMRHVIARSWAEMPVVMALSAESTETV